MAHSWVVSLGMVSISISQVSARGPVWSLITVHYLRNVMPPTSLFLTWGLLVSQHNQTYTHVNDQLLFFSYRSFPFLLKTQNLKVLLDFNWNQQDYFVNSKLKMCLFSLNAPGLFICLKLNRGAGGGEMGLHTIETKSKSPSLELTFTRWGIPQLQNLGGISLCFLRE